MDIQVGNIVKLKKQHPCGSREWEVLRIGADFRLKCMGSVSYTHLSGRRGKVVDMFRRKNGVFLTVPFFFAAVKWLKLLTSFVRQRHLGEPQQRKAGQ